MRGFMKLTIIASLCLTAAVPAFCQDADAEAESKGSVWIHLEITEPGKEKNAAETNALIPYDVAMIVLGAVPANYRQEIKDEGFDLGQIHKKAVALKPGTQFTETGGGYKVVVRKERMEEEEAAPATLLKLKIEDMKMDLKLPLIFAPYVVNLLTMTFTELEGLEEPLGRVVAEVQKLPPGKYVSASDGYSKFEIELE